MFRNGPQQLQVLDETETATREKIVPSLWRHQAGLAAWLPGWVGAMDESMPSPQARAHMIAMPSGGYMTVKEAIDEQAAARRDHRMNMLPQVRTPPNWDMLHADFAKQQSLAGPRAGPPPKLGFPRPEDALIQPSIISGSCTSSVALDPSSPPGSPSGRGYGVRSALGGSNKSGLNHTSTYFYGESPLKPMLCVGNQYNAVGSYSMFGSQVCALVCRSRAALVPLS